tara:strand:+ start:49 stop:495 length:447 start_codon:yes stop_codon:yes gene_type:complete
MAIDLKFTQDTSGKWHLDTENGDLTKTDSLDTAVYISLFGEKRASVSQVGEPTLRKGHFSNEFSNVEGYQKGCLFWLYTSQAPLTDRTLTLINDSVKNGLQWMVEDKIITKVKSSVTKVSNGVNVKVELINDFDKDSIYFDLFVNLTN